VGLKGVPVIAARVAALAFAVLAAATGARAADESPVPVRIAVILSGGQGEVPYVVRRFGLDKKHGLAMEQVALSAPGQQYLMFRSDTIDASPGTFIDLMRQRKAGGAMKAFHGFQGYNNRIVVKPGSAIKSFADLKGVRFGEFGTTFLDWLILRAAGKKAYGIDLEKDATPVQGAPPLLNQFLAKGEVDAMLQFSSLTLEPIVRGEQRMVADVPGLMDQAGFGRKVFNSNWNVAEKWTQAHPGAVDRLSAMIDDAYAALKSDDTVWPEIAQAIGITEPNLVAAYRDLARAIDNPTYDKSLIQSTQVLIDAIVAQAGEAPIGFTEVDPAAFLFPPRAP